MTKQVLGLYNTIEEARDAIAVFELEGHESKNVVVFADNIDANQFKDHQIVNHYPEESNNEDGFIEKIKDKFHIRDNPTFNTPAKLVEYGLTETEATKAFAGVLEGKIIVIVDNELRMGHA